MGFEFGRERPHQIQTWPDRDQERREGAGDRGHGRGPSFGGGSVYEGRQPVHTQGHTIAEAQSARPAAAPVVPSAAAVGRLLGDALRELQASNRSAGMRGPELGTKEDRRKSREQERE